MRRAILVFVIVLILTACQAKTELSVNSSIDKYSEIMSSVPGLPIEVKCDVVGEENSYELVVTCDNGEFILWGDSGRIVEIGQEYRGDFKDAIIYWRPGEPTDSEVRASITVTGEGTDSLEVNADIRVDSEGFYYLDYK